MIKAIELLDECKKLGISVEPRLQRNALWVQPISALPTDLKTKLVENKKTLLTYLFYCNADTQIERLCLRLMSAGLYRDGRSLKIRVPAKLTTELSESLDAHFDELLLMLTPHPVNQH